MLLACVLGACGDSGSSAPSSAAISTLSAPAATELPPEGSVTLPDKRIWTVVAPHRRLQLDDITVVVQRVDWKPGPGTKQAPLGTRVHAVATISIRNTGSKAAKVLPTQFWLIDERNLTLPHLPAGSGLVGKEVAAGEEMTGTLTFPMPAKVPGGILVYSFADAAAIAKATHVGFARY
jgi:hypothetical protein